MRTIQRDYTVIAPKSISTKISERESEYDNLWEQYSPKIRKIALAKCYRGLVGFDFEDIVQAGQDVLLHALRTHDDSKSKFSTYFYTVFNRQISYMRDKICKKNRVVVRVDGKRVVQSAMIYSLDAESEENQSESSTSKNREATLYRDMLAREKAKCKDIGLPEDVVRWIQESELNEGLKLIAMRVVQGYTNAEICTSLSMSSTELTKRYYKLRPFLEQNILPRLRDRDA